MSDYTLNLSILTLRTVLQAAADIFIIWLILYYVLRIVRNNSRTIQIFKGIMMFVLFDVCAGFLGLKTVKYFADIFLNWGILALFIIFQPEFRTLLEKIGKTNFFASLHALSGNEKENIVDQIVSATMLLSSDQTGALISIERSNSLDDFIETGIRLNSEVTAELLTSIFVTSTPLHDGAVIIQGDKIACASAYFPSTNQEVPSRYGARHRAAIGITEITDCVTIVVSEETGNVSVAAAGKLIPVDRKGLKDYLMHEICGETIEVRSHISTNNVVSSSASGKKSAMIEKLALRRQKASVEEKPETKMNAKEEKPARMQVESVVAATQPRDRQETPQKNVEEIHKAADAEAMAQEIKLPHKKKRPAPSYPDQTQRKNRNRQQRMTSQQVEEARRATATSLSQEKKEKPTVVMKQVHEQFDTTKLDISKIVGFNDELDRQFRMVDDLSKKSSEKKGGEDR